MYTLSSEKISAVWYSGTLNSKNKRLFSIRHCTIWPLRWSFLKVNDLTYNVKHGYINGNLNIESTSYSNTLNTNIRVLVTTYCHIMLSGKNFIDIKY